MNISDLKNISKDDILAALGLETRRTTGESLVSGLLMLGVGLAVGVGIGMLIAPKSGNELREDLSNQYRKTVGMAHDAMATDQSTSRSGTTSATGMGSAGSVGHKPV
jgi:gas vesicle protein